MLSLDKSFVAGGSKRLEIILTSISSDQCRLVLKFIWGICFIGSVSKLLFADLISSIAFNPISRTLLSLLKHKLYKKLSVNNVNVLDFRFLWTIAVLSGLSTSFR